MLRCDLCKVNVAGNKKCCPLCGGALSGEPEPDTEVFPVPERERFSRHFIQCILALVVISSSSVCVLINVATKNPVWWSLIVVFGGICAWITVAIAIAYRRDLSQNIAWQMILISGLSLIWDKGTGWHGWSYNFALPLVCAAGILTIPLLGLVLRLPIRSFSGALIVCAIIGLAPAVLVATDAVDFPLPSIICSGIAVIMLTSLLLFCWPAVKAELNRRLHV